VSNDLGDYLRLLRSSRSPADVGLPSGSGRRVTGLRRGEVSQLVGLSTEYYMRLEQGRAEHPSDAVVKAIARALRLDPAEGAHLLDLARNPRSIVASPSQPLRPELGLVIDAISDFPAVIMSNSLAVLRWNALARAVIADFDAMPERERNMARQIFLSPSARDVHGDWEKAAEDTVGILRLATRRPPVETDLLALVDELSGLSPDFMRLWRQHGVHEKTHGPKVFIHRQVGRLELQYETFKVAGSDRHMLVVFTAPASSAAATALATVRASFRRADLRGGSSPRRLASVSR
jgi:transcriptional regulator with XRE-family HTH domain